MKNMISNIKRRIRCAMSGCSALWMLIGAGALMLTGSVVRGVSGSPYQNGMMLRFSALLPPVWLMGICWLAWYALLGAVLMGVLFDGRNDAGTQAVKYRGGMTFLCMLFFGFLWYPTFFCAGRIFLSVLICASVLFLCILTACCYRMVFRLASAVLSLHALFLLWMLTLNVGILFYR